MTHPVLFTIGVMIGSFFGCLIGNLIYLWWIKR